MPPIVARFQKIDTATVNSIKAQTSGQVTFEYAASGLKIRTSNAADHQSVVRYLDGRGVEFYTFDPNPGQMVKYILRGLPPSTECEEIMAGLREKGVEVSHARQIKRNILEDGVRVVTLLPMWVITIPKKPENINNLKHLTGILNFVIRIQDYKSSDRIMQCFRCQNFGHKAEFCHIKDRCVKCAGQHNTRACNKDAAHPVRCANCGGQHSANYQGCPEAQKFKERRGTTRTPSKPQPNRKPNIASNIEFPELPRRQHVQQAAPEPSGGGLMDDFREILNLFKSGTISSYIKKFKGLMQRVKAQPDSMSKMLTFGLGLVEIFDD